MVYMYLAMPRWSGMAGMICGSRMLRMTTSAGFHPRDLDPTSADVRRLGVFVTPTYAVK